MVDCASSRSPQLQELQCRLTSSPCYTPPEYFSLWNMLQLEYVPILKLWVTTPYLSYGKWWGQGCHEKCGYFKQDFFECTRTKNQFKSQMYNESKALLDFTVALRQPGTAWPSQHLSSLHSEHAICSECFMPCDINESCIKDFSSNSRLLCVMNCSGLIY